MATKKKPKNKPSVTSNEQTFATSLRGNKVTTTFKVEYLEPPLKRRGQQKKPDPTRYLIIGFDTEYQTPPPVTSEQIAEGKAKYEVLSYQFHIKQIERHSQTSRAHEAHGIIIPKEGERIYLEELVSFAIGSLAKKTKGLELARNIYLVGHFTRADFSAFNDFANQAREFASAVRNTFVSIERSKRINIKFSGQKDPEKLDVRLRDTYLLAPANAKSLAAIGEIMGYKKETLSDDPADDQYFKENMKQFRKEHWQKFKSYALRDAEICVRYAEKMIRQSDALFGEFKMPVTLTSFGTKLVLNGWKAKKWTTDELIGQETIKQRKFNKRLGYYKEEVKHPSIAKVFYEEAFVTESYHGGRNEQYFFGIAPEGDWKDYDLSSAYTTAMAIIGKPDWQTTRTVKSLKQIGMLDLAFADIDFEFPEAIRFPTLPVRTANGIIFPRVGQTVCGAPEIFLAQELGAKIRLNRAVKVDTDPNHQIFGDFIRESIRRRNQHAKGTFENFFWKEVGNSTYGKTAQGLKEKRVYDLRDDDMVELPPSPLTQPFFASFITSYTRAVLGEILNKLPSTVQVFSVTTDGFLCTAKQEHIERALAQPLCKTFKKARMSLTGDDEVLEVKHQIRQPIGWRTRGSATLKKGLVNQGNIVLQKGGIKVHHRMEEDQQNTKVIELFLNRRPTDVITYDQHVGLKDMIRHGADFVDRSITKKLSMEYDWKRRPVHERDVRIRFEGKIYTHLSFDTAPLEHKIEFDQIRTDWEDYTKRDRECIKTLKNLEDFQNFCTSKKHPKKKARTYLSKRDGDIKRLRRDLCIAFKSEQAGFDKEIKRSRGITAARFASLLSKSGIPCKVSDVQNAKASSFEEQLVPDTERVRAALARLTEVFPELEIGLFVPNQK